uniref:Uncharacterized protein n=1 Tax=Stegastes partitus TaxID=144197 RepID=A0A3B4ZSZ2_9TELE
MALEAFDCQFRCPICLDILKDPVSIPCGHTYCMACINDYWDQAESGQFSCPQCRETFSPRPVLRRNTVLAEVVDKLKLSEMVAAPELYLGGVGEVPCDFCPAESKLRAEKSCLVCLASFLFRQQQQETEHGGGKPLRLNQSLQTETGRRCKDADAEGLKCLCANCVVFLLDLFSCRLSLDPDTAHPTLVLLEGPQGAHCGEEPQSYPTHPQRFDSVAQVLCREGQFGGASYWEVEWRGGGWVDIGVTYRGIGRKGGGKPCLLGRNENSWRLRCTHAGYAAWHDNRKTTVAAPPCPRIGVFLERQKGALSFYSVSDTMLLLHTFRCPFSQPLYPAFRLDLDSTLRDLKMPPG